MLRYLYSMLTRRVINILIVLLLLVACNIKEETKTFNGFIMSINDNEIEFYTPNNSCEYSRNKELNSYISDFCLYQLEERYDFELYDYVTIEVNKKGFVKSITEAKDLYQDKYYVKDLLKDFVRIEISCKGYDVDFSKELIDNDLIEFINLIEDIIVYKDYIPQYGAGGVGCELICYDKDDNSIIVNGSGLELSVDKIKYGYRFSANETVSTRIKNYYQVSE